MLSRYAHRVAKINAFLATQPDYYPPSPPPRLEDILTSIDAEGTVARMLHRLSQDVRENMPDGADIELQADVDALCSEPGRLEIPPGPRDRVAGLPGRLGDHATQLIPGRRAGRVMNAQVVPLRPSPARSERRSRCRPSSPQGSI